MHVRVYLPTYKYILAVGTYVHNIQGYNIIQPYCRRMYTGGPCNNRQILVLPFCHCNMNHCYVSSGCLMVALRMFATTVYVNSLNRTSILITMLAGSSVISFR